jgi:hypothetical protein
MGSEHQLLSEEVTLTLLAARVVQRNQQFIEVARDGDHFVQVVKDLEIYYMRGIREIFKCGLLIAE